MATEAHHAHHDHEAHPTVRLYIQVFIALMVALVVAVLVGYLVGGWTGTILSFAIGIFKAVLIILYFMHVATARSLAGSSRSRRSSGSASCS